jgi:hypothetical protein
MLETIVVGLVLAFASGITILAYKHPRIYKLFSGPLAALVMATMVGASIWDLAVTKTRIAIDPFVDPQKGLAALEASRKLETPFPWVFGGCLLILLYLGFLRAFPILLKAEKEGDL